jgi:hypothetical protein
MIDEGRDELRGITGICIYLGDGVLEYAVPDPGSAGYADWLLDDPYDTYHAITWKVADLNKAERHLEDQGVRILARSEDTIVTDPRTSFGIPWGFTTTLRPGDPRSQSSNSP